MFSRHSSSWRTLSVEVGGVPVLQTLLRLGGLHATQETCGTRCNTITSCHNADCVLMCMPMPALISTDCEVATSLRTTSGIIAKGACVKSAHLMLQHVCSTSTQDRRAKVRLLQSAGALRSCRAAAGANEADRGRSRTLTRPA